MTRNRIGLLVALGVDNAGSGLFLPLAVAYVTRVVGLPLATAGTAVAAGTAVGLLVPPLAGPLVDRIGPKPVVIAAELIQAAGALGYLVAHSVWAVIVAAVLLAAGQQAFYSSLCALIADVAGNGPKDRPFTVAGMVRSACFGLGGLVAGALITASGPVGFRIGVAVDAASFVACALVLVLFVHTVPVHHAKAEAGQAKRLLGDRPFLVLIVVTGLVGLATDFFLIGIPVYALEILHAPAWLPGTVLALLTGLNSAGGTIALRVTRRFGRTSAMALGAGVFCVWCVVSLGALVVPGGWRVVVLLGSTLVYAAGAQLFGSRANGLAEAAAPPEARGRYLAAFQYAFTVPGVIAPALVSLFSVAVWLPWLVAAGCSAVAMVALRRLAVLLPSNAVRPYVATRAESGY